MKYDEEHHRWQYQQGLLISRIMRPQLTSIDQMADHGSKMGLDILLDKIANPQDGSEPTVYVEYEPHLFVRGSTVEGADAR